MKALLCALLMGAVACGGSGKPEVEEPEPEREKIVAEHDPSIHEDDPARAINTALDVLDAVAQINTSNAGAAVAFRIGINTGLITTGRRGEHDVVTGHAMSVASRLQSEARTNSVLVSAGTHDHCPVEFLFSEPRTISVKGKAERITCYEVAGRNERPVDEGSVFVGRKESLDTILENAMQRYGISRLGTAKQGAKAAARAGKTRHEI